MKTSIVSLPAKEHLAMAGISKLPNEWEVIQVNKLLSEDRGISVGVMYPGDHDPNGIPLIKVTDLNGNSINHYPDFRISPEKHFEYRRTELEGGEILLTLVGGLGQCAIVPHSMAGWNTARAVAVIRLKESRDASYLRYCLLSPPLQYLIHAWANTTVQATINLKEIRQLPIPWPQFTERTTIAAILGSLDDKIELNRQMNRTLEAMAQALFKSWFVDFDPVRAKAEGRETGLPEDVAALFPDRLVESELGEIPEGWSFVSVVSAFDVNPPRSLTKGQIAPYLDMANMPTQGHHPESWTERPFGSGMKFINGDTLLARITPCLENGKTAFVDFLADDQVAWGSTEYIVLRPKRPLPLEYAYFLARHENFRTHVIQNMTGTSGRQRASATCLEHYYIALPSEQVSNCFDKLGRISMSKIKANMDESRTLADLRDTLLPKLISGEVRVRDMERFA